MISFDRLVLLAGMPRSGTSWLSQIVESSPEVRFRLSPLFSYALKNVVDERSPAAAYRKMFDDAYRLDDEFMTQRNRRCDGTYPVFSVRHDQPPVLAVKMTRFHHLLERMLDCVDDARLVSIVRHPCGAINSWLRTPKEFPPDADPAEQWRSGAVRKTGPEEFWGFDDWKAVTSLHLTLERTRPDQVRVVRYADLVDDASSGVRSLFEFLDLPFTAQTEAFIAQSQGGHTEDTHGVFKHPRVKDRWQTELAPEIQDAIHRDLVGTELEGFLS